MTGPRIDVPNTHPLYDPPFARDQALKYFEPWLHVGREIEQYGSDLLLRAMTGRGDSIPALVVLSGMFRQVLSAADGALLCLENGAVQQALLHTRSLFEGSVALHWTLADRWERRARQYYVSSIRQNRSWALRVIPGTSELHRAEKAWKAIRTPPEVSPERIAAAREQVADIDRLLAEPVYREINAWFEQYGIKGKGKKQYFVEPNWYQPGPDGVQTIGALARAMGRDAEYESLYRFTSYFVHGSLADNHFRVVEGKVRIEPIRYLKEFASAFNVPFTDLARTIMTVTQHFRHQELPQVMDRWAKEWLPILQSHAKVVVEPVSVDL